MNILTDVYSNIGNNHQNNDIDYLV